MMSPDDIETILADLEAAVGEDDAAGVAAVLPDLERAYAANAARHRSQLEAYMSVHESRPLSEDENTALSTYLTAFVELSALRTELLLQAEPVRGETADAAALAELEALVPTVRRSETEFRDQTAQLDATFNDRELPALVVLTAVDMDVGADQLQLRLTNRGDEPARAVEIHVTAERGTIEPPSTMVGELAPEAERSIDVSLASVPAGTELDVRVESAAHATRRYDLYKPVVEAGSTTVGAGSTLEQTEESGPGFGVPTGLAGIGGAAYLLRQRLSSDDE